MPGALSRGKANHRRGLQKSEVKSYNDASRAVASLEGEATEARNRGHSGRRIERGLPSKAGFFAHNEKADLRVRRRALLTASVTKGGAACIHRGVDDEEAAAMLHQARVVDLGDTAFQQRGLKRSQAAPRIQGRRLEAEPLVELSGT